MEGWFHRKGVSYTKGREDIFDRGINKCYRHDRVEEAVIEDLELMELRESLD